MAYRSLLRDLRHYGGYVLDQAALGVFQAVAITVDRVMDSRAPVDGSRERVRQEALAAAGKLAAAEEFVEVWESESDWLGNGVSAAVAETGPPEVSADPPGPSGGPSLTDWLIPAICEVLAEHEPATFEDQTRVSCGDTYGANHYASFRNQEAWRDHVAPLIAEHIAAVLPHYGK